MVDQVRFNNSTDINLPLRFGDITDEIPGIEPPQYQHPQFQIGTEWKDIVFFIIFWIHAIAVIVVGLVLGPASYDENLTQVIIGLSVAATISTIGSILTFGILQLCASRLIQCAFFSLVTMTSLLAVGLFFVDPYLTIVAAVFVLIISIVFFCIRDRVDFAEAHLYAACISLRSHLSLIIVAVVMLIVQILWFIFWILMMFGIYRITDSVFTILLIYTWYWGAATCRNVVHFITACCVGHWWFDNQIYTMRDSIKRSLTLNFGTICFGSFFEAIIKTLRFFTKDSGRKSCVTCCCDFFLRIIEKCIGYLNEWGFIYSALTGHSFLDSSRCFIQLFRRRGWTMVINDSLIGITFMMINFGMGLIAGFIGTFLSFLVADHPDKTMAITITIGSACFFVGFFTSTIITTILTSAVRSIFVCFALNPAALGASHPEQLQLLTRVWYKFYPNEFASSGYTGQYQNIMV